MHEIPAFLTGAMLGAIAVMLLWIRDLARRAREDQLAKNREALISRRLAAAQAAIEAFTHDDCPYSEAEIARSQANIAAILGPEEVARLEAEALDEDEPERFVCSGCGDEMSENDFLTFNEMCRGCERERAEEEAADARAER